MAIAHEPSWSAVFAHLPNLFGIYRLCQTTDFVIDVVYPALNTDSLRLCMQKATNQLR